VFSLGDGDITFLAGDWQLMVSDPLLHHQPPTVISSEHKVNLYPLKVLLECLTL
jgi:hypothetical protein